VELETALPQLNQQVARLAKIWQAKQDNVTLVTHCPELVEHRLFLRLQLLLRQNA
jgi:hypothetical protein